MKNKNYIPLKEASDLLDGELSTEALRSRIRRNSIHAIQVDGKWMVPLEEVEKIKQGETPVEKSERVFKGLQTTEERLQFEVEELGRELKKAYKVISAHELEYNAEQRLHEGILKVIGDNPYRPAFQPAPKLDKVEDPHEMVLMVSDAHYGEYVDPEALFGVSYTPEICTLRMEHLRNKTIRYKEMRDPVYTTQKLTIAVLGDMISGNIHDELDRTNLMPISSQWAEMAHMLANLGFSLREHFADVEMIIIPGNHPRIRRKPYFKQKWDNFEYMMGLYVQALVGDAFTVTVPKSMIHTHDVLGFKIGMSHGDGYKSNSFAGIPFYGLAQRRSAFQAARKELGFEPIDMLMMGHFHQLLWWPGRGCDVIINGSIKGPDEYAFDNFAGAEPARQGLLTLNQDHGVTAIEVIDLGHIGRENG